MSSGPRKRFAIADREDALAREIGFDRALSLQLLVPQHRSAVEALWRIDAAMGDVIARSSDPLLARIKLAWWREQLQQLDHVPPPAEPRLRAAATELLPRGISGAEIAAIEPGWATLLEAPVDPELVAERGSRLFEIVARLLGGVDNEITNAGALWALVSAGAERNEPMLFDAARSFTDRLAGKRFPMWLRGLSVLARLAADDLKHGLASPTARRAGRGRAALGHIWTGIVVPGR